MDGKVIDLAFIMDASGSIGDQSFSKAKLFLMNMIRKLDIGPDKIRIGLVVYSGMANAVLNFDQILSKDQVLGTVADLEYYTGTTRTGNAIMIAQTDLFPHARGGKIPKIAVVITDGQSQDLVKRPSEMLRDDDVTLYAVGVTDEVNVDELLQITGDPGKKFTVAGYDELDDKMIEVITGRMCKTVDAGGF